MGPNTALNGYNWILIQGLTPTQQELESVRKKKTLAIAQVGDEVYI